MLTVTADVDPAVVTSDELNNLLEGSVLPALAERNPVLTYLGGGERRETTESLATLGGGFALALLVIHALLAIPFASYTMPLIIMATIPFGIVGGVLAHVILGIPLGLLSLLGMVGPSGVVVNDSLVMLDFMAERLRRGVPAREAIISRAKARFRPILPTSVTTFLGVVPLIFEKSVQAQFLIPMAASLGVRDPLRHGRADADRARVGHGAAPGGWWARARAWVVDPEHSSPHIAANGRFRNTWGRHEGRRIRKLGEVYFTVEVSRGEASRIAERRHRLVLRGVRRFRLRPERGSRFGPHGQPGSTSCLEYGCGAASRGVRSARRAPLWVRCGGPGTIRRSRRCTIAPQSFAVDRGAANPGDPGIRLRLRGASVHDRRER